MIGFELPTVRAYKNCIERLLNADTISQLQEDDVFGVSDRSHSVTPNECPLARILLEVATDDSIPPMDQYALASLVASSQIINSPSLEQIFSCRKTLLFYPKESVKYRIWNNVLLRHFLQEFGPTPEIGLTVEEQISFLSRLIQ